MTQDRPTAAELVQAIREFLEHDVMAATDGRVQFHARIAGRVLAMVERELADPLTVAGLARRNIRVHRAIGGRGLRLVGRGLGLLAGIVLLIGVDLIDTADIYGFGANEILVGKGLKPYRDKVKIATKFGLMHSKDAILDGANGKPEYVRQACEESLKRLGIETIDR